jgi:hypothetical protein
MNTSQNKRRGKALGVIGVSLSLESAPVGAVFAARPSHGNAQNQWDRSCRESAGNVSLCSIDHWQMADIFISYSKASQAETKELAQDLQAKGFTIWYDTSLVAGDSFGDVIMTELAQARAAIVIWDTSSIKSEWVRSEASRPRARRILIPVRAEGIRSHDIPPPFDSLHTELLSNHAGIDTALAKLGVTPTLAREDKPSAHPPAADIHRPGLHYEQKIHFCMSRDGVQLAYSRMGGGPPLVKNSSLS